MLHTIGYTHRGRRRPVLYRASIAEMVVPYGTPERSHYRKNVFDSGEIGFGRMANSLKLGCDCLGTIHYFDAAVPGRVRHPAHDRECDLPARGRCRSVLEAFRRPQRPHRGSPCPEAGDLVDLHDRQLRIRVVLVSAPGWPYRVRDESDRHHQHRRPAIPASPGKYGTEVAPGIVGHIHQHIFCARLDMEVDGPANTVVECDTIAPPTGPENPYGNAFYVEERPLTTECEAQRNIDFARMRYWKIVNPETRNWVGTPTAYKLEAGVRGAAFHASRQPVRAARPVHPAPDLGHAVPSRGTLPGRRVRQPVARRRRDRRPGPRATGASRTPISCCGTVSACIICRGRRIIRCSPA